MGRSAAELQSRRNARITTKRFLRLACMWVTRVLQRLDGKSQHVWVGQFVARVSPQLPFCDTRAVKAFCFFLFCWFCSPWFVLDLGWIWCRLCMIAFCIVDSNSECRQNPSVLR